MEQNQDENDNHLDLDLNFVEEDEPLNSSNGEMPSIPSSSSISNPIASQAHETPQQSPQSAPPPKSSLSIAFGDSSDSDSEEEEEDLAEEENVTANLRSTDQFLDKLLRVEANPAKALSPTDLADLQRDFDSVTVLLARKANRFFRYLTSLIKICLLKHRQNRPVGKTFKTLGSVLKYMLLYFPVQDPFWSTSFLNQYRMIGPKINQIRDQLATVTELAQGLLSLRVGSFRLKYFEPKEEKRIIIEESLLWADCQIALLRTKQKAPLSFYLISEFLSTKPVFSKRQDPLKSFKKRAALPPARTTSPAPAPPVPDPVLPTPNPTTPQTQYQMIPAFDPQENFAFSQTSPTTFVDDASSNLGWSTSDYHGKDSILDEEYHSREYGKRRRGHSSQFLVSTAAGGQWDLGHSDREGSEEDDGGRDGKRRKREETGRRFESRDSREKERRRDSESDDRRYRERSHGREKDRSRSRESDRYDHRRSATHR